MKYINASATQLYEELNRLRNAERDASTQANQAILLISRTLQSIRKYVQERGFKSEAEEIQFFKHIKPKITGRLIYYRHIYDIEVKRLVCSEKELEQLINRKKSDFSEFAQDHLNFISYYRLRYTHLDKQYFLRNAFRVPLPHQNVEVDYDPDFTTPYDHLAAKVVAKDLFYQFLLVPLREKSDEFKPAKIKWTSTKSSLVELIYALHYSGSVENGNSNIKEICERFEKVFDVQLKDVYGTFRDIQLRKGERAKYLISLVETFDKKLEESEGFG